MKYICILILIFFTCCNSIDMKLSHRNNRVNKNNEKQGVWLEYYSNGKLKKCESYISGKLRGASVSYFENGKIERKANYKNGELNGIIRVYNDQGFMMSKSKYSKGGFIYIRSYNPY